MTCIMFSLTGLMPYFLVMKAGRCCQRTCLVRGGRRRKQGSCLKKEATYSDNGKIKDGEEKNKAFRSYVCHLSSSDPTTISVW